MDDEWSSVVEQALQYASPLPVLDITSDDTSGIETPRDDTNTDNASPTTLSNNQVIKTIPETCKDNNSDCANADVDTSEYPQNISTDSGTGSDSDRRSTSFPDRIVQNANGSDSYRETTSFLDLVSTTSGNDHCDKDETVETFTSGQIDTNSYDIDRNKYRNISTKSSEVPCRKVTTSETVSKNVCNPSIEKETHPSEPKVKKTRKRVKNPDPPPEPILPPCSVCDEKSSGYHYGANTCEACKGFFRRTLKKTEVKYKCKCKPEEKCEWERGPVKNGCASCRYKRCVEVGMSKDAIKIGRYTLQHKTENINQVKSVESLDKMIDVAMTTMMAECSPSSSSVIDLGINSPGDVTSPMTSEESSSGYGSSLDSLSPHPKRKKVAYAQEIVTLKEVENMVTVLTEAQTRMEFDDHRRPLEVIRQKQTEYLEKYNIKKELFGDMGLSKEEFVEFYRITGIDLDGRLQHMDGAFDFFERKISQVVAFAKSIPGFKQLTLNDQANLIKASRTESTLLGGYRALLRNFDMERRVLTTPWGKEIHLDELKRIVPINFINAKYERANSLIGLNLTVQEESLIRAIVTMFTDRCTLEEPHKADLIQQKLVACLQHLLTIRSGGAGTLFYKIFSLITNLRNFNENETEFTKTLLQEWPMLSSNKYQLLKEFLS